MSPTSANELPLDPNALDATALARFKEFVRRDRPEGDPFRVEVEAILATDSKLAVLERFATVIRLSRRPVG
ncbi:MAG: hypothetical protein L3K01_02990 [Thermoplasmata archaeon]|nr:hypothetical protein [Thermoplasmata archaeon]MCI4332685.1 hypothetical protein [Thermoplasmata archaeon]